VSGTRRVKVDALPDSAFRYLEFDAIVCIDVIVASTTVVTSVAQGRRTFPARSVEEAKALADLLTDPVLAGDVAGKQPDGFELGSGPAGVARRSDVHRPLVLVSAPGTQLIINSGGGPSVYVASFRNISATVDVVASRHHRVAVLGAGYGGEFRCEDQMAAAWITHRLMERGFESDDINTSDLVKRWAEADISLAGWGKSAEYLRRLGQREDLDFVLNRVDDLGLVCRYEDGEVRALDAPQAVAEPALEVVGGERLPVPAWSNVVAFEAGRRQVTAPKAPATT
jgi:phosphosulfolactate phosphohydrolase-like enzyme